MTDEPVVVDGENKVYPLVFTHETIEQFWAQAKKFPTIFGHEIVGDINKFMDLFFFRNGIELQPKGLFWVLNPEEFTGIFYINNILEYEDGVVDCQVHYAFFDKRHHGRVQLVKKCLRYLFEKYQFQRISADIPNYVTPQARHFAMECGFAYEGKRRKSTRYKGEWFDTNLYGILRSEALNGKYST